MASLDVGRQLSTYDRQNCEQRLSAYDRQRCEQRQAIGLFWIVYPFCLVSAIAARLTPKRRAASMPDGRRSVFGEARAAAASCVPFAFR